MYANMWTLSKLYVTMRFSAADKTSLCSFQPPALRRNAERGATTIRHYAESEGMAIRHYGERGIATIRNYVESARLAIRHYAERGVATIRHRAESAADHTLSWGM